MNLVDLLLPEFDREMGATRRYLERVTESDFLWKPHPKSWSLQELATHLSRLPSWGERTLTADSFDLAEYQKPPAASSSIAELIAAFDERVAAVRRMLVASSNAELMAPWTLKKGKEQIFTLPKVAVLRSMVLNHMIHHRGQLSVYLRERNVPLPPLYGPTADEG